jgi:hypothetical protein
MKKCFKWYVLAIIFCFFSNFSSNAYKKEDLEHVKTMAGIIELVLVLPLEFIDKLPPECVAAFASTNLIACSYSHVAGNFCCRALESNENVVSMIARLLKVVRLKNAPLPICLFFLKAISLIIANKLLNNKLDGEKYRIKRRYFRACIFAVIDSLMQIFNQGDFTFDDPRLNRLTGQYKFATAIGMFIGNLISNGMAEYIGEKIIQGAEGNSNDLLKTNHNTKNNDTNPWEKI